MKVGDKMYVRICKGLSDKGKLIPATEDINKHITNDSDYYMSVYQYNEKQKEQFEEKGTVSGIKDVVTNQLIFDFDSEDVEEARKDSVVVVDRLIKRGIESSAIEIDFSGNKGFHVIVHTANSFTPVQAKKIALAFAKDLSTFDSVVYNSNRILRIANTKHPKTKLYKTPLTYEELNTSTITDIKDLAKEVYSVSFSPSKANLPEDLLNIEDKKPEPSNNFTVDAKLDLSKKPRYMPEWKYAMEQGFFPAGQRNNALTILAATYKSLGYNKTKAFYSLLAAADLQAKINDQDEKDETELTQIVDSVYSDAWNGGTYTIESAPIQLINYLKEAGVTLEKQEENIFDTPNSVFDVFRKFAENIDKNTIPTGITGVDKNVKFTTSMLVGLLGAPSSGKTTVAMEVMANTSKNGENVAFFSMDMGAPLVFQRLAQKVTGYTSDSLFKIFKEGKEDEIKKIKYKIDKDFTNVDFCFKTAMGVGAIKRNLIERQEKEGKKYRLVVIDYLECIGADISDPTAKISGISQELKDLANDLDVCVLLLLQPPKRAGDPSYPLLSYSDIKGAATVAQACSIVVSLWREGFSPKNYENDEFISFAVLKNRMGKLSSVDCFFDGLTGSITSIDEYGQERIDGLRAIKSANKKEEGMF